MIMSESKKLELKPCPFCGSDEIEKLGRGYYAPVQTYQRICLSCGVVTKEFYSPSEADNAWNARAEADRIAELEKENERLKAALENNWIAFSADENYLKAFSGEHIGYNEGGEPVFMIDGKRQAIPLFFTILNISGDKSAIFQKGDTAELQNSEWKYIDRDGLPNCGYTEYLWQMNSCRTEGRFIVGYYSERENMVVTDMQQKYNVLHFKAWRKLPMPAKREVSGFE